MVMTSLLVRVLRGTCTSSPVTAAVLWLCQRGADVAAVKGDGWRDTALHYAAARGHSEVCQVLLAYGASLGAENYAGNACSFKI